MVLLSIGQSSRCICNGPFNSHSGTHGKSLPQYHRLRHLQPSSWAMRDHSGPILGLWLAVSLLLQMLPCTSLSRSTSVQLWAGGSKSATMWLGQIEICHSSGVNPRRTWVPLHSAPCHEDIVNVANCLVNPLQQRLLQKVTLWAGTTLCLYGDEFPRAFFQNHLLIGMG